MPYIDEDYYISDYQGVPFEDTDFNRYATRASELIDQLTHYRIKDFDNMHDFTKSQIKKATAAQVEHYKMGGGYEAIAGSGEMGVVSIGSFSYGGGPASDKKKSGSTASSSAISHLKPTGLLYSGIGVV